MGKFVDAVYARRSIELAEQKLHDSQALLQKTRRLFELGEKGKPDVVQIESQVAEDNYRLLLTFTLDEPVGLHDGEAWAGVGAQTTVKKAKLSADTSLPPCDLIARFELLRDTNPFLFRVDGNVGNADVFLKFKPGTDAASLEPLMNQTLLKAYTWLNADGGSKNHFGLMPLRDSYFSHTSSNVCQRGDPGMVFIIIMAGIVILVFSIINYINLTTAQVGYRSREMATRRLLGCTKQDVRLRLVLESIMLCLCSVLLAVVLAWLAIPYTNNLLETSIHIVALLSPLNLLLLITFVLLVGVVAGVLPATLLSHVSPIDVVRGTFCRQTKMVFSKVFIVVQNLLTIVFLSVALILTLQTNHLIHAPLGYDTEGVMEINISQNYRQAELFKKLLLQQTFVKKVSVALCSPFEGGFNQMSYVGKQTIRCQRFYGDKDFLSLFGIGVQRQFAPGDSVSCFVAGNFSSLMQLPAGSHTFRYNEGYPYEVINGVLTDFHLMTIVHRPDNETSVVYVCKKPFDEMCSAMLIKVEGDESEAYSRVQELYHEVYQEELAQDHPFLNQKIAQSFKPLKRIATLMSLFAFIAVVVSFLGLVAMSMYFIQQRHKEIALRKVFGSTGSQITRKLIRSFLVYVLLAFVIAVPIVWYVVTDWISQYAYRIVWWPWLLVAGFVVVLISFAAVALQSRAAGNENPVKHIKENQ